MAVRPRERLLQVGAEHLNEAELLAILLRTGRRGQNVLELASALLAEFGSLAAMERASLSELRQRKGL
ncbi:MAG: DNA repair protein RadC, partial [Chloroflexi bacterium]|nr:DNA repair protein RadC [Chloroflexota bacterium]